MGAKGHSGVVGFSCLFVFNFLFYCFGRAAQPPAVEARNPNHWTSREFPRTLFLNFKFLFLNSSLYCQKKKGENIFSWDFPGGAVVKNLPATAGNMGSSPGPGGSHMSQSS